MKALALCILFILFVQTFAQIDLVLTEGSFALYLNKQKWLDSGAFAIHINNKWYSSADKSLSLVKTTNSSGTDKFGNFKNTEMQWSASGKPWITSIKTYPSDKSLIFFTQTFPEEIEATATGNNVDVISAFPTFSANNSNLHYLTYHDTFAYPHVGRWYNKPTFPQGPHGGVPLALFDSDLNTIVLSPFDNFMVGIQAISKQIDGALACGIQGKVKTIPAGFSHTTVLSSSQGVNQAFNTWGALLLKNYGKAPKKVDDDFTVKYLGYYTDNGAYYYYLTEPGKDYATTMIDSYNYIESIGLPVKYYQFDSWWYFKASGGGLDLWEPRTDIFPKGMKDVDTSIGNLPLVLHNRWFAPDNQYIKQGYAFNSEKNYALPKGEDLYYYIMSKAKSWGMIVYEQDWLVDQYLSMEVTQDNVDTAREWMLNMDSAATKAGLTIQLCMPLPMHVLQSAAMHSVTHIRASVDYKLDLTQWKVGHTSMLINALGAFPFKDNFWSSYGPQTNCIYNPCVENNTVLETLVSVLSMGPVAPADKINYIDKDLVMQTCNADGLIIKPDVPATTMDITFKATFKSSQPQLYEITSTRSTHSLKTQSGSQQLTWYYIFAASTQQSFVVTSQDLPLAHSTSLVYEYGKLNQTRVPFDASNPLRIPPLVAVNSSVNFKYYVVAPVLKQSSYSLIGESDKFVTTSSQRFSNFQLSSDNAISFNLSGASKEVVHLTLLDPSQKIVNVACTLSESGAGSVVCPSASQCTC